MNQNNVIYIENFALTTDTKKLKNAFTTFGKITDIELPNFPPGHPLNKDQRDPMSKGYAFIHYQSQADAEKACNFFKDLNRIRDGLDLNSNLDNTVPRLKNNMTSRDNQDLLLCRVMSKRDFTDLTKNYQDSRFKSLTKCAKMLVLS